MFYIPYCAKSATGTIPKLAEALINRNHSVTIGKLDIVNRVLFYLQIKLWDGENVAQLH